MQKSSHCSIFRLHAKHASASEAGDYFQVLFEETEQGEDSRYFLVQRQFEFPDGGCCAIETELPEMCGHYRIRRAVLERRRFQIWWLHREEIQAEIRSRLGWTGRRVREDPPESSGSVWRANLNGPASSARSAYDRSGSRAIVYNATMIHNAASRGT